MVILAVLVPRIIVGVLSETINPQYPSLTLVMVLAISVPVMPALYAFLGSRIIVEP